MKKKKQTVWAIDVTDEGIAAILREKYPYGHPDFIPMCLEEIKLHSEKNYDFAFGGDPLGNFKRVSQIFSLYGFELPPDMVAQSYCLKQYDAALHMRVKGYEAKVEDIDSRLRDVGVYSKIARILYKEEKSENKSTQ